MGGPASAASAERVKSAAKRVRVGFKEVGNAAGSYAARALQSSGIDNSLDVEAFARDLRVLVTSTDDEDFVFEVEGIDAPIANAVRRILLSEVPTVAIETVFVHGNSSIMPDEMLAHRLGLVPLAIDPRRLEMRAPDEPVSAKNTVKFRLRAACRKNTSIAPKDEIAPPEKLYVQSSVYSSSIEYVPFPNDDQMLELGIMDKPKPVHGDIVLVKMRPDQKVHVELDAVKGIGRDHAKFSPVATASYRMLPEVTFKEVVDGERALALVEKCPMNVFDIEESGCAVVKNPRDCTMCRECIREPEWNSVVELTRKRDHFIFSVESTGALPAAALVTESLKILGEKCRKVEAALDEAVKQRSSADTGDGMEVDSAEGSESDDE